jgi:hypothetical protein
VSESVLKCFGSVRVASEQLFKCVRNSQYDAVVSEGATIAQEIDRYVRTGDSDPHVSVWQGGFLERAKAAQAELRGALVQEVTRRAEGQVHPPTDHADLVGLTRAKVEPMVRGLFPRAEQDLVLAALERSVVVVTGHNIERLILTHGFDDSAWTLANLYLASIDAELLSDDAPRLVGLSEEATCYVMPEAFEDEPFSDFIVHEAAHVFHNCKRRTLGLRETRTKEWLLDIDFAKRETFAYSCEAYSRVLARVKNAAGRRALADEYSRTASISEERVDPNEVASILAEAAASQNGWKIILSRCAPRLPLGGTVNSRRW